MTATAAGRFPYRTFRTGGPTRERLVVTQRTVERHVKEIFPQLDLTASPDSHRRVLAVLAYLRG